MGVEISFLSLFEFFLIITLRAFTMWFVMCCVRCKYGMPEIFSFPWHTIWMYLTVKITHHNLWCCFKMTINSWKWIISTFRFRNHMKSNADTMHQTSQLPYSSGFLLKLSKVLAAWILQVTTPSTLSTGLIMWLLLPEVYVATI